MAEQERLLDSKLKKKKFKYRFVNGRPEWKTEKLQRDSC